MLIIRTIRTSSISYLARPRSISTSSSHPLHYSIPIRTMSSLKRKSGPFPASPQDAKKPKKDATLTSFFGAPKPSPQSKTSAEESTPIKFEKDKWVATLTEEQKKLLKLEIDTLDPSWLAHLKDEVMSREFLDLKRFLQKERDSKAEIFPPPEDVYSWSRHTPLTTVRVVLLGQDPYHNNNQAHGLCFSVRPPTPAPPSLKNMFSALAKDYPAFTPPPNKGGLLTPWANQGVLMLNTCLTVRAHEANSHANKGWEKFTQKVIDTVVKVRSRGVVFLAWGSPAQKRCVKITGSKHLVLKSVHPSPLSAARGFFDCGHFRKANDWLEERYGKEGVIDWSLDAKKSAPIKEPAVDGPVKVTGGGGGGEKKKEKQGPTTELPVTKGRGEPIVKRDEFDGEDDEDAIEALEELARSGVMDEVVADDNAAVISSSTSTSAAAAAAATKKDDGGNGVAGETVKEAEKENSDPATVVADTSSEHKASQ